MQPPADDPDTPPVRHRPIDLVVFDMDDVLCRYDLPVRLQRLAALCSCSPKTIRAAIWDSGFEEASDAGAFAAEAYLSGFGERLGYPMTRPQWVEARRAAMTPWPEMLSLVSTVKTAVDVALLTNNGLLTKATIADLFPQLPALFGERLFVSAEFGTKKPDPAVYRRLLARLGVAPRRALMVDDKVANVEGAAAAGLTGHRFDGREGLVRRLVGLGVLDG